MGLEFSGVSEEINDIYRYFLENRKYIEISKSKITQHKNRMYISLLGETMLPLKEIKALNNKHYHQNEKSVSHTDSKKD